MKGSWITFEGIGGSGKTTLVNNLFEFLQNIQDKEVVMTKEPGGTEAGEVLRGFVLKARDDKLKPFTELMIYEADRHETCSKVVEPALKRGAIILSDRGIDGSVAYQGYGKGLDIALIDKLTYLATNGKSPDLTILVDVSPELAKQRITGRPTQEQDQFDMEKIDFQTNVREGFLYAAKRSPTRVYIVNGDQSQKAILEDVIDILRKKGII